MNKFSTSLIYVIDDDREDFDLLNQVIVGRWPSMQFEYFEDPHTFVNHLGTLEHPCFIVLDINMPKINGFEVLTSLKENVSWKKIPVVFLSTSNSLSQKAKALELGAASYLVKPSTAAQWEDVVKELHVIRSKHDC